jgi:outer membrane protein, heavy metal efflux system
LQDNRPLGTENSNSWSVAVFGSVPLFNRNQGNIRRAETNVAQTRSELGAINHHVEVDVDQSLAEYQASLDAVQRIERTILPRSRRIRDASLNLMRQGEASALDYLNAQREYNDVVRQYRDALIRHRRATLRLNTAIGMRLLP